MKNRIKSYSFWVGLSAAIILLVQSIGRIFGFSINAEIVDNLIMSICGVLVVLGIVIKPTDKSTTDELSNTKDIVEDKKSDSDNTDKL